MVTIIVVGGGIIGLMHAYAAVQAGWHVTHLEREADARGASVRNFGLVWVSGRRDGAELTLASRARELWHAIGSQVEGVGFRENGSLTLLRTTAEVAVAQRLCDGTDAAERGIEMWDAAQVRHHNPALGGQFLAGVHCRLDAAVESRLVPAALRAAMAATGRYEWLPGREIRQYVEGPAVIDHTGQRHDGDLVVLCTGAAHTGLAGDVLSSAPLRRVRLQMMQTAPLEEPLTTSVADGDSMRYYPAWDSPQLGQLPQQSDIAAQAAAQLLMVQRLDGGLTIGDTHEYDEPFDFDVREDYYDHLRASAEQLLGRKLPPIARRWAGVYSQYTASDALYYRSQIAPGVVAVTGPGGRGMTCAPAIAEETFATL